MHKSALLLYLKSNAHDRPEHVVIPLKVLVKLKCHLQQCRKVENISGQLHDSLIGITPKHN